MTKDIISSTHVAPSFLSEESKPKVPCMNIVRLADDIDAINIAMRLRGTLISMLFDHGTHAWAY